MIAYENWLSGGISTSRRTDMAESGLWYAGEGIFYTIEVEACPEAFVSSGGSWYDVVRSPEMI